jgi:hypothetical protein
MKRALEESNDKPVVGRIQNPINFCSIQGDVVALRPSSEQRLGLCPRLCFGRSPNQSPDDVRAKPNSLSASSLSQESPMLNQKELGLIQIDQRLIQSVLFNTDILKTIINQYNDPCIQLKTVFDILFCCKNEILPNNGLIIICGDLGISDKLDRPKIFPILIDTLTFYQRDRDSIECAIALAYEQISSFFYPYYEDCTKQAKCKNLFHGVPFLITGGFPSTCYLNIKNALKINFKEYVKSCDYDLSFVSDNIDELEKFGKNILSKLNPTTKIEIIKNDAIKISNGITYNNGSKEYFNKQNSKFILDYPKPVLKELYKVTKRICTNHDYKDKKITENPIHKERHLLDIKIIYSQKEKMDSVEKLLFNIFSSFDLTCSCFAFLRISEIEKMYYNDEPSEVKVYSTPYNLYSIISKNYNFTSIIYNPTKKRISKYEERGWNYKKEQEEAVKKEKVRKIIHFQRPEMTKKKYAANQNARNYLLEKEKLSLLDKENSKNEYENAVISVISKLVEPKGLNMDCHYYRDGYTYILLSKSQILSQYNFEKENISKQDYIILYGMKKILKDLLNRGYIEISN